MPKNKVKKKKQKRTKRKKLGSSSIKKELILKTKKGWISKAIVNKSQYEKKYKDSSDNNDSFWKKEGKRISWIKPYTKIKDVKYSKSDVNKIGRAHV